VIVFLCSSTLNRFEAHSSGLDHCPGIWAKSKWRAKPIAVGPTMIPRMLGGRISSAKKKLLDQAMARRRASSWLFFLGTKRIKIFTGDQARPYRNWTERRGRAHECPACPFLRPNPRPLFGWSWNIRTKTSLSKQRQRATRREFFIRDLAAGIGGLPLVAFPTSQAQRPRKDRPLSRDYDPLEAIH